MRTTQKRLGRPGQTNNPIMHCATIIPNEQLKEVQTVLHKDRQQKKDAVIYESAAVRVST